MVVINDGKQSLEENNISTLSGEIAVDPNAACTNSHTNTHHIDKEGQQENERPAVNSYRYDKSRR